MNQSTAERSPVMIAVMELVTTSKAYQDALKQLSELRAAISALELEKAEKQRCLEQLQGEKDLLGLILSSLQHGGIDFLDQAVKKNNPDASTHAQAEGRTPDQQQQQQQQPDPDDLDDGEYNPAAHVCK